MKRISVWIRRRSPSLALFLLLSVLAIAFLLPFYWSIVSSVKSAAEVRAIPPTWWPQRIVLANFTHVWSSRFARYMLNSLIYSLGTSLFVLATSSFLGFIIEKYPSAFGNFLFWLILATMMVPFQTYVIPLFKVLIFLQRLTGVPTANTYWGLIFPWIFYPFGIFLLRQAAKTFPTALMDMARIDGCSTFTIYVRVVLPLMTSSLASLGILIFMWKYDDLLWPLIVASDDRMYPVTMGVLQFVGEYWTEYQLYIAASLIAIAPAVLLFLLLQRSIIKGIATEGLKG